MTDFFYNICLICEKKDPVALKIQEPYRKLKEKAQAMEEAYGSQKHELSDDIEAANERRNEAVICLRKLGELYSYYPDKKKKEAANKLLEYFDRQNGSVTRLTYQDKSTAIRKMCSELKEDETLIAVINELNGHVIVNELEVSNEEFRDLYMARNKDLTSRKFTATELGEQCVEEYDLLLNHIQGHAYVNPSRKYDQLVAEINQLIKKYENTIVAKRAKNMGEEDTEARTRTEEQLEEALHEATESSSSDKSSN